MLSRTDPFTAPDLLAKSLPAPDRLALFLDVDGTLIGLTHEDRQRGLSAERQALIQVLALRLGGALAIVSGRDLEQIDRIFPGLSLPAAGMQGLQQRFSNGQVRYKSVVTEAHHRQMDSLAELVSRHFPRSVVERKSGGAMSFVFPAPTPETRALHDLVSQHAGPDLHCMWGAVAVDLMPHGANKGIALLDLMEEPPFAGRIPVHIGDDIPDEFAFSAAAEAGGRGIAVGRPRAGTQDVLADVEEVWALLKLLAG